jgi:hypothetical protein
METAVSSEPFYLSFYLTGQHHMANLGNFHGLLTMCILICDGSFNTLVAILYIEDVGKLYAKTS